MHTCTASWKDPVLTFEGTEFAAAGFRFEAVSKGHVAHEVVRIVEADIETLVAA